MISKYNSYKNGPLDRYIKLTEAAKILDFAHYSSVVKLIEKKKLNAYLLPHVTRRRVLLSEVNELQKLNKWASNSIKNTKRKRGRPFKY